MIRSLPTASLSAMRTAAHMLHRNKVATAFGSIALLATITLAYLAKKLPKQIGLGGLKEGLSKAPTLSSKIKTLWFAIQLAKGPLLQDWRIQDHPQGYTPLHVAASRGDLSAIEALINLGAPLESVGYIGSSWENNKVTPLFLAAKSGHVEAVRLLLEKGASVTIPDHQTIALHMAASALPSLTKAAGVDHAEVARILVAEGAKVDVMALGLAAKNGNLELFNALITLCDCLSAKYDDGSTLIHAACSFKGQPNSAMKHAQIIQMLHDENVEIDAQAEGETALHLAVRNNNEPIVKKLLALGADAKILDNGIHSLSPLHIAAIHGQVGIIKAFADAKRDLNVRSGSQETPLHRAVYASEKEATSYLIEKGADIDAKDESGRTPLLLAAEYPHDNSELIEVLVQKRADVNTANSEGQTPLHLVVQRESAGATQVLIEQGKADVNAKDKDGKTPLHYAKNEDQVKALIQAGADVNALDDEGKTPLLHLVSPSAVLQLIKSGATVDAQDKDGKTPLVLALQKYNMWHNEPYLNMAFYLIEYGADPEAHYSTFLDEKITCREKFIEHVGETTFQRLLRLWEQKELERAQREDN